MSHNVLPAAITSSSDVEPSLIPLDDALMTRQHKHDDLYGRLFPLLQMTAPWPAAECH